MTQHSPFPAPPADLPTPDLDPGTGPVRARLLHDVDAQIARLALAMGLALDERQGLLEAMRETRVSPGETPSQHRHTLRHVELRGLLVLRYEMIRRYADEIGPEATRGLLFEAEQRLLADGFAPGSDGIHLDSLFGPG